MSNSDETSKFFTLAFLTGPESLGLLLLWTFFVELYNTFDSEHQEISVKVTEMPKKEDKKSLHDYLPIAISLGSLLVSLGSLFASLFTMDRQRLFQERSLLPAISVYYSWNYRETNEGQENSIKWKIENTGKGSAVVRNSFLQVGDNEKINMNEEDKAWDALNLAVNNYFNLQEKVFFSEDSIQEGYAIQPNSEWDLFELSFIKNIEEKEIRKGKNILNIAICSCSFDLQCSYDDTDPNSEEKIIDCPDSIKQEEMDELLEKR